MKKLILIFCLLLSINVYSQKLDSLNKVKLDNIQLNLEKFHERYNAGTWYLATGIFVCANGAFITKMEERDINKKSVFGPILMFIGVGASLTGYYIQVDSHKYINLAYNSIIFKF